MGIREDFLRRIQKKQAEIAEMESHLRGEKRYLEAMQDAYRLLPKEAFATATNGAAAPGILRRGSGTSKAYEALKRHGKPMHVNAIAEAIGKKPSRQNTQSLASSMRAYVLKGELFTKPAPNTYGLTEWGEDGNRVEEWPDGELPDQREGA